MRFFRIAGFLFLLSVWPLSALSGNVRLIDSAAVSKWLDGRDPPLVLDVRGRAEYLQGTIPGALDAGSDPAGFLPDSRGGGVVLLGREGADIAPWGDRLGDFGFRVYVLAGGLAAWRAAGFPTERPENSFVRPGTVPFVIPRGICELNEPAEVFH